MLLRACARQGCPRALLSRVAVSVRACSTDSGPFPRPPEGGGAAREAASSYDQFNQQRQQFHRHSFHEAGQRPSSSSSSSSSSGGGFTHGGSDYGGRGTRVKDDSQHRGDGAGHTAQERRKMSKKWENAFFGRVHFEDRMHEKYAEAVARLESERQQQQQQQRGSGGPNERGAADPNGLPAPDRWPADEPLPPHVFARYTPEERQMYIIGRLTQAERRVRYAPDYGSLSMMYQLNLGERLLDEAEHWLRESGWMNDEIAKHVADVRAEAYRIKYDYDLD